MSISFYNAASAVFTLDEGTGPPGGRPYKDTKGYWTIGIGHFIGERLEDLKLSPEMIEHLFTEDLATAIREARFVVGNTFFDNLSIPRQIALVSMLFTLGRNKFLKFEQTIDAMKEHNWEEVANRILASKWARDVDPKQRHNEGRDDRIAYMFKTGEFHPQYGIKV